MDDGSVLSILYATGYSPKQLVKENYSLIQYSEQLIERIKYYPSKIEDNLNFINDKLQKISNIYHVNKKSKLKYVIYIFKKDEYEIAVGEKLYFINKKNNEEIILDECKGEVSAQCRNNKEKKIGVIKIKYRIVQGINIKSVSPYQFNSII